MNNVRLPSMIAIAVAAVSAPPAHGSVVSVSDIFNQFNAVIFETFSSSADVEGRTVVGGDLIRGATFELIPAHAASSFSGLTVYGSATSDRNGNVNNGGGVTIAGSNSVTFSLNGGGTAYVGGANSGNLNSTNGTGSLSIGGPNSGTLQLSSGGSVYVGGQNSGGITVDGSAKVSINGGNAANINMNGGGTLSLNGSNSGTVSLNGGTFTYTGTAVSVNLNGGATATKVGSLTLPAPANPLPSFADTFQTPLTALSKQLDALAANSIATSSNNAITFKASANAAGGTAIFDINSSFLTPNATVTLNLNGAESVIINVNVDSCVSDACVFSLPTSLNFANPTSYADQVLWNFVNATGLNFPNEIGGSVLAPLATVSNSSPINGTLVAASYSGQGELHSHSYSGTLPDGTSGSVGGVVPVPEPTSLTLVGSALLGLVVFRRRTACRATAPRPGRA